MSSESSSSHPRKAEPLRAGLSLSSGSRCKFPRCRLAEHASGSNWRFPQAAAPLHRSLHLCPEAGAGRGRALLARMSGRAPPGSLLPAAPLCSPGAGESSCLPVPSSPRSGWRRSHLSPPINVSGGFVFSPGGFCASSLLDSLYWELYRQAQRLNFHLGGTSGLGGRAGYSLHEDTGAEVKWLPPGSLFLFSEGFAIA